MQELGAIMPTTWDLEQAFARCFRCKKGPGRWIPLPAEVHCILFGTGQHLGRDYQGQVGREPSKRYSSQLFLLRRLTVLASLSISSSKSILILVSYMELLSLLGSTSISEARKPLSSVYTKLTGVYQFLLNTKTSQGKSARPRSREEGLCFVIKYLTCRDRDYYLFHN